jgi:phytoene synthase
VKLPAQAELDAAGITSPALRHAYGLCRRLNAAHGKTYYLATLLLPAAKRPYVHALYGFARYVDDIVDDYGGTPPSRAERLTEWSEAFLSDLEWGGTSDPVARAVMDTIRRWQLPHSYFADFLESMRMDLTVTEYETYADLERYMWGSAAVIGLQMLPILGRADESLRWDELEPYAIDLGVAFQLTNFIRDVGDDLRRGRIYLPQESLRQFGVDRDRLARRRVDEPIRNLLAFEIERTRQVYRRAEPGIDLVDPTSRDCLRVALTLYGEILDRVEAQDYDVFAGRASVPLPRRARVAGAGITRALRTRREGAVPTTPTPTASSGSWRSRTAGPRRAGRRLAGR